MLSDALDGQGRKARFGIMVPGWGGRLSDDQQLSRHRSEVALFKFVMPTRSGKSDRFQ